MRFFQIIRWKNLLLIATVQVLIKYHLLPLFQIEGTSRDADFVLLLLATLFIAAAGYVINDMYDIEADAINKPDAVWIPGFMTLRRAKILYFFLNFSGLLTGFMLCWKMAFYAGFIYFIIPVLLLYLYAKYLKKILLLSNILIALLVSYAMLIVLFFEKIRFTSFVSTDFSFQKSIYFLLLFSFFLSLAREIVKDTEDVIGDKLIGVQSIPIVWGLDTTKRIIKGILHFLIGVIVSISLFYYAKQPAFVLYLLLGVGSGLVLLLQQLSKTQKNSDFSRISILVKLLFVVGIISVLFIQI